MSTTQATCSAVVVLPLLILAAGSLSALASDGRCMLQAQMGRQGKAAELSQSQRDTWNELLSTASSRQQPPPPGDVLVPTPDDTVSAAYWSKIDEAIETAGRNTPPPPTQAPANNLNKWESVFSAGTRESVTAQDLTPEEVARGVTVNGATDPGPMSFDLQAQKHNKVVLVPYDMQLGARIMDGLTEPVTPSPPPSQQTVSQQFVAQCPMIMFRDSLKVHAPTCGDKLGTWLDPASGRSILRWDPLVTGGIRFGVDSVVGGNGSATFADFKQTFSFEGTYFELSNCLKVLRYTVEEKVIKINHVGRGLSSSITEHDISLDGQAYFYKYLIKHQNGSTVAETGLFRLNQNEVNITMLNDEVSDGKMVARARRIGQWDGPSWRKCSPKKREWEIDFMLGPRDVDMVATVMDLRVAAAAVITLMAFREETVSEKDGGVNRIGEHNMFRELLWASFILLLCSFAFMLCVMVARRWRWDVKASRFCFKLEAVLLPKRPARMRLPEYPNTAY